MISSHEINRSLYSFRALACLGVFLIHASLPGAVGVIVTVTSRWAVPFFFLTSGYFAYGAEQSRIKLRAKKTLHLFAKWLIFYVCINWIVLLQQGKLGLLLKNALDFSNWLFFLRATGLRLLRAVAIFGTCLHCCTFIPCLLI